MSKSIYRIPTSIDKSYLDHEVNLSGGGFRLGAKPMKVLLFWSASILVLFWAVSGTFLSSAGFLLDFAIVIWWIAATAFFGSYGKTKEMKFVSLPALVSYLPPAARQVVARSNSNPSGFYGVCGIQSIDENGYIVWLDGSVGRAYLVVGSASILLFPEDRKAILNRVDSFWRKIDTTAQFITMTTKEPQRVYRQLSALESINQKLVVRDPDLLALADERYSILRDHVGENFTSIHQYLIVKADNLEALQRAVAVLTSETEASQLMIKQCTTLDGQATQEMFRAIYARAA